MTLKNWILVDKFVVKSLQLCTQFSKLTKVILHLTMAGFHSTGIFQLPELGLQSKHTQILNAMNILNLISKAKLSI